MAPARSRMACWPLVMLYRLHMARSVSPWHGERKAWRQERCESPLAARDIKVQLRGRGASNSGARAPRGIPRRSFLGLPDPSSRPPRRRSPRRIKLSALPKAEHRQFNIALV